MDEFTADAFANRDEPLPVPSSNGQATSKDRFSVASLKERFSTRKNAKGDGPAMMSLQDRLLTKLLEQVIPVDEDVDSTDSQGKGPKRFEQPALSLHTMTNNFRRFNARIGIVFDFQVKVAKLLSWRRPTQTWSFLAVYSLLCLNPSLWPVLPLVILLLWIMVPSFLARHPPPPPTASTSSTTPYYSYEGPALAPASTIKPVPETSKDFFRNLRDLQNSMADFVELHDAVVSNLSPITNFSDEILSSTAFLLLAASTALLFLTAHLIPWRFLFLVGGNAAVISSHPTVESFVEHLKKSHESATKSSKDHVTLFGYSVPVSFPALMEALKSLSAITLDSLPEEREVEIFELQHKVYSPYAASVQWEPFVFTPTPYDPLSPARIAGDRPKGTRFFEDVRPPPGWAWKSKKWELDIDCAEWVMERMVTGVEFEVPGQSGNGIGEEVGGWVWDLPFQPPDNGLQDETAREGKGKAAVGPDVKTDWEETTKRSDRVGEWRRRRWVRVVQRVKVDES
ncbi:hypothetical protein VTO42DRAFT_7174 [Malbranchea cinnamomea]